jgi:hypothetical protein
MRARERRAPRHVYGVLPARLATYPGDLYQWQTVDAGSPVYVIGNRNANSYRSIMVDKGDKARFHMNDCSHCHCLGQVALTNMTEGTIIGALNYVTTGDSSRAYFGMPISTIVQTCADYVRVFPYTSSASTLERGLGDSRLPKEVHVDRDPFDSGFSIWYLIVDVIELVKIYKRIFRPNDLSKRYRESDRLLRLRETLTGSPKEATAKQLANSHLFARFGLLPTIDDFTDMLRLLKTWTDRYDQAKELFRKKHVFHLPKVEAPWQDLFSRTFSTTGHAPSGVFPLRAVLTTSVPTYFHRSLQYQYAAPEFLGWITRLKQFVDAFGVLDPAAIWDIVPFSFVVDWFINIGRWLHKSRPRLFSADVKVLDYCESIKRVDTVEWYMDWIEPISRPFESGNPTLEHTNELIYRETYTTYVRRKFSPYVSNFSDYTPAPGRPKCFVNLGRVSIASSLLAQRLPR